MKRLFIAVMICLLLPSCASAQKDLPVQILGQTLGTEIENFENLGIASVDYLRYCMQSDLSLYDEYLVLYPFAGTEYKEIGIFKLKDASDKASAKTEILAYLAFKEKNWDTRYNGDEFSKIQNAKIIIGGRYILYTILAPEESDRVIRAFKAAIQ